MTPRRGPLGRLGSLALPAFLGAIAVLAASPALGAPTPVRISTDPFTNASSQHATEVEPDDFAWGSTIVAAFQVGRFTNSGASDIGWATSTNGGATWTNGFLQGITSIAGGGPAASASDPSVAYDARHAVWMIAALTIPGAANTPGLTVSRSTDGGLSWGSPVAVAGPRTSGVDFDKTWTVCDDTSTSPFYGRCYASWQNGNSGRVTMTTSDDGGLHWSAPVQTAGAASGDGTQPLVQPSGRVIVTATNPSKSAIVAFTSDDGGATWTAPLTVTAVTDHPEAGLRSEPLPSAEIDASGRVYVAWQDCRFQSGCSANDIVMTSSADGRTWGPVSRVPIDAVTSGVDHFIPGLAVDRSTTGATTRLALAYHFSDTSGCPPGGCPLSIGVISSADGGSTWSPPATLAGPMNLDWLASTTAGRMVGDYVSTAFTADGVAHPVFMAATAPSGGRLVEAAYTASVPVGPPPVGNQPPHASFSVSPAAPQVGETVTFTDTSTDPNGAADITGRAWDLDGDGVYGDATTPTASRSFAAAGTYTVGLRVTDAAGAQDTTTVAVTVSAPGGGTPIPAGNLTANPSFETGASNWSGVGATVARTALAGAPNGGFVAKVTRTAGAYFTLDDTPATVPSAPAGATYKATAWVRAASASSVGKQAFVSLREQTAGGGFVQSANGFVTLTNTFQPVSATLTARTAGDVVDVYAGQSGGAAGDAFYVDLISVVRAL